MKCIIPNKVKFVNDLNKVIPIYIRPGSRKSSTEYSSAIVTQKNSAIKSIIKNIWSSLTTSVRLASEIAKVIRSRLFSKN